MKTKLSWSGGMKFSASAQENSVAMDAKAPIGNGSAMTPKELVAAGLGGCSAMDVIAHLKKNKQAHTGLDILVDITTSTSGHPMVFTAATLTYQATGSVDPAILLDAVRLSQTKYCGVSAMLIKAFPIHYVVQLNGATIGEGDSHFDEG